MPAYLKTALSEDFQAGVSSKVIVEKIDEIVKHY